MACLDLEGRSVLVVGGGRIALEKVAGLLLFHSHDEPALPGFQSGVYYVDATKKASFEPVRDAIDGASCPERAR